MDRYYLWTKFMLKTVDYCSTRKRDQKDLNPKMVNKWVTFSISIHEMLVDK